LARSRTAWPASASVGESRISRFGASGAHHRWYPTRLSAYRISFQTRRLLSTQSGSICKTTSYRWQRKVDNLVLSCAQDSELRCLAVLSTDGDPHTPSHHPDKKRFAVPLDHPVRHRDPLAKYVAALRKQSRSFIAWASPYLRYTTLVLVRSVLAWKRQVRLLTQLRRQWPSMPVPKA
jgi:hypothetical protein